MIDCPNADVRDQLPDLVSGALSGSARAVIEAHVEQCAECRAEVALLSSVRGALIAHAPTVDEARIRAIVAALPSPVRAQTARTSTSSWRTGSMGWRIAATVVFMAVGGTLVVLGNARHARVHADSVAIPEDGPALATSTPELALPDGLDSLSSEQLQSLLKKIDHLDGLPAVVPDVGDVPLGTSAPGRADTLSGGAGTRP